MLLAVRNVWASKNIRRAKRLEEGIRNVLLEKQSQEIVENKRPSLVLACRRKRHMR
jgi:hypothetical protein